MSVYACHWKRPALLAEVDCHIIIIGVRDCGEPFAENCPCSRIVNYSLTSGIMNYSTFYIIVDATYVSTVSNGHYIWSVNGPIADLRAVMISSVDLFMIIILHR